MSVSLKLPDGSVREVPAGTRPREVAESIGKRLAAAAVAAKVNGEIVDLERELPAGEHTFELLTDKNKEALDVLRHSTAHIMARAVMRLFPGTQLAFGPTTENGYYYDIESPTPITEADFPKIEEEMRKIVKLAEPFERFERPTAEGKALVLDMKQKLKGEHIDEGLSQYDSVSFYRQGEFIDLCRGPHIPHAGKVGAFKLLSIAGAYWKNDAKREVLQRLYGTAFFEQKQLDEYLKQVEEAKKRDHRVLGKQLKLFTISQVAGQGMILWMPKGATLRHELEQFIRAELVKRGYSPVFTPHIGNLNLYRTSGHFPYYADAQFPPMYFNPVVATVDTWYTLLEKKHLSADREKAFLAVIEGVSNGEFPSGEDEYPRYTWGQIKLDARALLNEYKEAKDDAAKLTVLKDWMAGQEGYLLKPMNCPHHIQIYKAVPKSYRDLPLKLAEFGTVYRYEQSGELGGMTRVRGFTQDDAHLFVTPDQVEAELRSEIDLVLYILRLLNLTEYRVRVSVRDPESSKYVGDPADWEKAEATLKAIVESTPGLNFTIGVGEAAFYGPKIDFIVKDCIGREWQLGTVQLDYNLPKRFELEYTGSDNATHRPVMLHRAPFGSLERFCGILIEHFAGAFPLWLAPEQARVLTISEKSAEYGKQVEAALKAAGLRVTGDYRSEKVGGKVAVGSQEKVPYLLVVGEKDAANGTVSVRDESIEDQKKRDLGPKPLAEVIEMLKAEIAAKTVRNVSTATANLTGGGAKFEG
jgi:threonyl-tRNA synthetase